MDHDRYFAAGRDPASERDRLETLASFYDPATQDWLTAHVSLQPGDRVLEFGFGCGSMLVWFAERVGPTGCVLGIDQTIDHAPQPALPIRTRTGDILAKPDEAERFDLVYARLLMEHLADPARALRRMVEWTTPGGHVAVLDLDCTSVAAVDPAAPNAETFDRAARELSSTLSASGLMDPSFGRRVATLMAEVGLNDIRETRMERVVKSGSPWAKFQATNTRLVGAMVDTGEAANASATLMERPGLSYHDQTMVAVIGRVGAR